MKHFLKELLCKFLSLMQRLHVKVKLHLGCSVIAEIEDEKDKLNKPEGGSVDGQ